MENAVPQRSSPLEDQVVEILVNRILRGDTPAGGKLPSESELSRELQVSRGTVRAALSRLVADGLITRRHGSGTYVRRLTRVANPLNEVVDYRELIEGHGFAFGFQHIGAAIVAPLPAVAEALRVDPAGRVLQVVKAFTADDELLLYTVNTLPEWVYADSVCAAELLLPGATEPLWDFLEHCCRQPVEDFAATIRPGLARGIEIDHRAPSLDPSTPVLIVEEVGFNREGLPVLHEIEYLFGDRMRFDLVRRLRRRGGAS